MVGAIKEVGLIHGFGRGSRSMSILARRLRAAGFVTRSFSYTSRRTSLQKATSRVAAQLREWDVDQAHLVGHSFGGLIALTLKQSSDVLPIIGRVVQMGSPNLGVQAVGRFRYQRAARWIAGSVVDDVLPRDARGSPNADVLAIAGTGFPASIARFYGVRGPNDALIEEASAYGTAANARVRVDAVHGWLPLSKRVATVTARFLNSGVLDEEIQGAGGLRDKGSGH